ncbi:MAG TPA: amidohydrolase family protein [Candidatus Acidoferrum sp.]
MRERDEGSLDSFRYSQGLNPEYGNHALAQRMYWWQNAGIMKPLRLAVLLLLVCMVAPFWIGSVAAQETLRYKIVSNETVAGTEVDKFSADGRIDSTFEFNDRGRGPKISAQYVIGANGLPLRTDVTGNDYLKAPVDEHFVFEQGRAHWKSTSEDGSSATEGFYVSNNGPGAELALLVEALVKAKGGPVKLLPAGEARLERVIHTTLEAHGQKLHVTEFAITGLSFEPQTVWLDDQYRLFGTPGTWFAILREGWESKNQLLYELQRKAEEARYGRLAKGLAEHPKHAVTIEHVRVFDSEQAAVREDQTVVIEGERIAQVGPAVSIQVPKDAERIDGSGKTLLPGLFDMHAHVQPLDGLLNIASGVTSVRDMGNGIEDLGRLEVRWKSGEAIGPRVWKSGMIDGPGPFQVPTGLYVTIEEEARAAVNRYADLGYVQIKLYSSLKPELVPGIVKTAHQRGLRVSGHVPNGMIASQFVEAGADELQHINFIFLNFLASQVKDTRTPERFTAVGANAAKLDLDSKPVKEFIELLLNHHTTVDVTLATFEGMFTGRPGVVSPDFGPILSRLPAQVQRGAYSGGLPVTGENDQLYKDSYAAMLRMTKRMYDAGIPILAGTDALAGLMLHRELELEVKAGIPPAKALQIATFNAAGLLKQGKDLGSIGAGKLADLVLVEGNPAEKISDIRRCRLVVKNGVVFKSDAVYAAVGIKPAD